MLALVTVGVAGGGLGLGYTLRRRAPPSPAATTLPAAQPGEWRVGSLLRIAPDGQVTLVSALSDIGQGVKTALPMLVAEELEVDWAQVQVEQGDLDPAHGDQFTGASRSVAKHHRRLRQLGAVARTLLVRAAAARWQVPEAQCQAASGRVHHRASGRSLGYGELAAAAASMELPDAASVPLKPASEFRLIGQRVGGVDNLAIVTGALRYGIDLRLPGLLHAVLARCPVFGGTVATANLDEVKALPGVRDAFVMAGSGTLVGAQPGVAIVAESTWAALRARRQLRVTWNEGAAAGQGDASHAARATALLASGAGAVLRDDGDVSGALASATQRVEARYDLPFLAHHALEPLSCTAWVHDGRVELWVCSQNPARAAREVADALGLSHATVRLHGQRAGGAFGRRLDSDFIVEAAVLARQVAAPVQLLWTREDDLRHDHYRAGSFHQLRAGLSAAGAVQAWHHHAVVHGDGVNAGTGAGLEADEFPARWIDHCRIEQSVLKTAVPLGFWRAPGANATAWVVQSFIDELAHAGGRDPLELRLALLGERDAVPTGPFWSRGEPYRVDRMKAVLREVAQRAGWGRTLPRGRGQGLASHHCHAGYAAQVVEVTVTPQGRLKVDRVVCVCDVGAPIVNLSGAEQQVVGAILDGLSAAWFQQVELANGRVVPANFDTQPLLRMADAPAEVEVHFLPSEHPPTGLGEPALPPLAPALCNAIFRATGQRLRRLPIAVQDLAWR